VTATDTHRAIEAVFRIEQAKLIGGLMRMVRDVGTAEELAQDALVAALEQWPNSGIPDNPGAWLMTAAKHKAIDRFRRDKLAERKEGELGYALEVEQATGQPDLDAALDDQVGDDLLRLIFIACHPVLSPEAQAALTLRLLGGLTTAEIARAFLIPEATIQQRIVRAKRTLSEKRVPFEAPRGVELEARLASVLSVIYLIFNEGYAATAGDDWMRPQLCEEALRLGRILAELARDAPEVHGLVALMEIQMSRFAARAGPSGEPVLLLDQDRSRWDQLLIRRGLAALARAEALSAASARNPHPYVLQASIAACHARARSADDTDWAKIVGLYGRLGEIARLRWSSSTAPSRWRCCSARRRGSIWSMRWPGRRSLAPITCCRAYAASCCGSSAVLTKPAPNSNARRRSLKTSASASSSSIAPRRAHHPRPEEGRRPSRRVRPQVHASRRALAGSPQHEDCPGGTRNHPAIHSLFRSIASQGAGRLGAAVTPVI
jgi:RNA polymerase sigma factor (sigma-70 family)